jgi:radical SAM protein with 4Fe4S-binding SPASM domain
MGFYYFWNQLKQRLLLRNFTLLYKNNRVPPPSFVVWDATKCCNLDCIHCSSVDLEGNELDLIEIMTILDQVAAAGVRRLQITGGEPLLREDLFRVIHYAAVKKFSVSLASNGYFIDEEKAELLVKAGISLVQVSIDGPSDIHNAIRGDVESFIKAVEAVRALKKQSEIHVGVATTVMPQNLSSLPELQSILVPLKVDFWSLGVVMPAGKAKDNPALFLDPEQFHTLLDFIPRARHRIHVELVENYPYLGKLDSLIRRYPKICPAGILSCCIGVDGWLRGCPDQEDTEHFREGDLRQDRFNDLWQCKFHRYRDQSVLLNDPQCGQCTDAVSCRGGCWVMREKNLHCYRANLQ